MATRLKTVEFWVPLRTTTVTDATDTDLTQITIYLPEGTKTFRSVVANCVFDDLNGGASNVTRRQLSLRLGAAAYTVVNNTGAIGQGGENWTLSQTADFTAHFTANWSGTSMTCDTRVLFDSAQATPVGFNNVSLKLTITYEYNDDAATQIKTVHIPLNMPTAALGTTKPGTAVSVIPQLTGSGSPYLPENSPTIRQTTVVVQNNTQGAAVNDRSYSTEVAALGAQTTALYEHSSTVDKWIRFHHVASFDTTAARDWFVWSSHASFQHGQAWLVVTYEFTLSGTSTILNSVWLPLSLESPMGGTASTDAQRGVVEFWIEEPATITTKQQAAYLFWTQSAAVGGLYGRYGTGSFIAYTADAGSIMAGSASLMIRNDSAFTLARGKNTLTMDVYRTDTSDLGWRLAGLLLVNYTSGVPSGGPGAANHTVQWTLLTHGTGAGSGNTLIAATAPIIPETSYFLNPLGFEDMALMASTAFSLAHIQVERLSSGSEGGVRWETLYLQYAQTDPEPGIFPIYTVDDVIFQQWPGDPRPGRDGLVRLDLETARRWRLVFFNTFFHAFSALITYHTVTFTVSGTVSGYVDADGAGLTVEVFRNADKAKVAEATTTSGGAYTATVYDNTGTYFASCREDATHVGRSDDVTPTAV